MISKEKEIFSRLANERLKEVTELDEKVKPGNLIYVCKGSIADVKFNEFDNPLNIIDLISLAHAKIIK